MADEQTHLTLSKQQNVTVSRQQKQENGCALLTRLKQRISNNKIESQKVMPSQTMHIYSCNKLAVFYMNMQMLSATQALAPMLCLRLWLWALGNPSHAALSWQLTTFSPGTHYLSPASCLQQAFSSLSTSRYLLYLSSSSTVTNWWIKSHWHLTWKPFALVLVL